MEKLVNNIDGFLLPIFILLIIASPFKLLSLICFCLFLLYELSRRLVKPKFGLNTIIIFLIFFFNIIFLILDLGISFISNYLLFLIFISPILLLITDDSSINRNKDTLKNKLVAKKVIECFLSFQLIFSVLAIINRLSIEFRFDTDFGDIVAGTFRSPFLYKADASNVIFVFTMVLVLFIYKCQFKNETKKYLEYISYFIVFLASVNHLILAVFISFSIVSTFRRPVSVIGSIVLVILLYSILQPANFNLILDRFSKLYYVLIDFDLLSTISLKGKYILNFINDFKDNIYKFLFVGVGGGNYSSRAALFFTGEYVSSFPFTNMSSYMNDNTFKLWNELLLAPPFLSGAFNYPYGSVFTFIAELGLLSTLIIFFLFYRKLMSIKYLNKIHIMFLIIFLLISGFIDNYYEYYQSTYIFYFLIKKFNYSV